MVTRGKFEGCTNQDIAQKLHDLSLNGCDEELGDVETFGWHALIGSYIISEDNQGFFSYTQYDNKVKAREAWLKLEADYQKFEEEAI